MKSAGKCKPISIKYLYRNYITDDDKLAKAHAMLATSTGCVTFYAPVGWPLQFKLVSKRYFENFFMAILFMPEIN